MKRPISRIFILLLLLATLTAILAYQLRRSQRAGLPTHLTTSPLSSPRLEPKRSVRLYFVSAEEESLKEEVREVRASNALDEEAKTALLELIKGPNSDLVSPLPSGTQLLRVFVDGRGVAYVDFNSELRDHHPGGSTAEMLAIYSIVDTLAYNFEQVKSVKILINGEEVDTLAGHIDLRTPLKPRLHFDQRL